MPKSVIKIINCFPNKNGATGPTGTTGATGATGPNVISAHAAFDYQFPDGGAPITIPAGGATGIIPLNRESPPTVGFTLNTATGDITCNVSGIYLLNYGVKYTITPPAQQLPIGFGILVPGSGTLTHTVIHSGTSSALDGWLEISTIIPIAAGAVLSIRNNSGTEFDLYSPEGGTVAYINFTRVGNYPS